MPADKRSQNEASSGVGKLLRLGARSPEGRRASHQLT